MIVTDLSDMLDSVERTISKYVIFPTPHESVALALWVAHAHAIEAAATTAYLHVSSPVRESGKSRVLEVLEPLVPSGHRMVLPTAAVVYGLLGAEGAKRPPVLLIDEVDQWIAGRAGRTEVGQALLGVLNDGYRRGGSVLRTEWVGRQRKIQKLSTFGAKALAGIDALPDPIASRCIPIRLQRKRPVEQAAPFRERTSRPELERLRDDLALLVDAEMIERLERTSPEIPPNLSDRQADLWEPLLAIAEDASGAWPLAARDAAVVLHARGSVSEEAVGIALLRDCARVFAIRNVPKIGTADLARALVEMEDASGPWAEWWRRDVGDGQNGIKVVGHRLAKLLKPFGIDAAKVRIGERTVRGYVVSAFEEPVARYIAPGPPFEGGTTEHARSEAISDVGGSIVPFPGGA